MIKSDFIVDKRDFVKKKRSMLKTKIINMLKAYTLREFAVNDDTNTVTCKISIRRDGVVREFPKTFTVVFQLIDIADNDEEATLRLHVSMS